MPDYDAIVIGSGAGGLAAAVALANAGQRVLVLEQHYIAGGWCQSFVLGGHRFSPGVHYIGDMRPGEPLHELYRGLGVSGDLEFCRLNEDGYDHFDIAGAERFDVPEGRDALRARLEARFPGEAPGLRRYFDYIHRMSEDMRRGGPYMEGWRVLALPFKAPTLSLYGMKPLGKVLDGLIRDPLLRAFLTAQAGDYAMPPSEAWSALHAGTQGHYFNGGFYPRGGAHRIPRAFVRRLKRQGGELRLAAPVRRIVVEGGRAVGVEIEGGERIGATTVISNADPEMTYRRLVGEGYLSGRLRTKLGRTTYSMTSLGLFLATDLDLGALGYDSGNYWYYRTTDIDAVYRTRGWRLPNHDEFDACFVTITSLKDPSKRVGGTHTVEVFTFLPWEPFARFEGEQHGARSAEYEALKESLGARLLRTAEHIVPGLGERLTFMEVGSPLTNEHFCAGHRGAVYGTEKNTHHLGFSAYPIKTEVPGLFMVGASTISHGVYGATFSGVYAAAKVLRCKPEALLGAGGPEIPLFPSERPDEWLASLAARRNRRGERVAA